MVRRVVEKILRISSMSEYASALIFRSMLSSLSRVNPDCLTVSATEASGSPSNRISRSVSGSPPFMR